MEYLYAYTALTVCKTKQMVSIYNDSSCQFDLENQIDRRIPAVIRVCEVN